MPLRMLRFLGAYKDESPSLLTFEPEDVPEILADEIKHFPAVYVAVEADVDEIVAVADPDAFQVRREQHRDKGLWTYFGSARGHQVLRRCKYDSEGNLRYGVHTFLGATDRRPAPWMYLLGTTETLFRALADSAFEAPVNVMSLRRLFLESLGEMKIPDRISNALIGRSHGIQIIKKQIMIAARRDNPHRNVVLIQGDIGTGKSLVARLIHEERFRGRKTRFVSVNCSAIPHDLLESELFGTEAGASTGAVTRAGYWEIANGGTLFLDEIGDLHPDHQGKILHALEECFICRVGSTKRREVTAAVIVATNRDLRSLVERGLFRSDLYSRIDKFIIPTYPVRELGDDVTLLIERFWKDPYDEGVEDPGIPPLDRRIVQDLKQSAWAGNVREVKAVLHGLHALYGDNVTYRQFLVYRDYRDYRPPSGGVAGFGSSAGGHGVIDSLKQLRNAREALARIGSHLGEIEAAASQDHDPDLLIQFINQLSRIGDLNARPERYGDADLTRAMQRVEAGAYGLSCRRPDGWTVEEVAEPIADLRDALDAAAAAVADRIDRVLETI